MAVLPTGIGPVTGGYQIERSLRFNSADSAYLNRTFASAGNRATWTWSAWVKRSFLDATATSTAFQTLFHAGVYTTVAFSADSIYFQMANGAGSAWYIQTSQVFRDPSAWYHIVAVLNTTAATPSQRMRLYINGVEVTVFSTDQRTSITLNTTSGEINNNISHAIGGNTTPARYFSGYQTETYFIDGQALTPSDFGETDTNTGVWKPKAYTGTYGTNGFYLKFTDNSGTTSTTLGKDTSGNGNNWTPNNFYVGPGTTNAEKAGIDSLVDSPTSYGTDTGVGGEVRGNDATLNPLNKNTSGTLSNGNLEWQASTTAVQVVTGTSTIIPSGKTYFEVNVVTAAGASNYYQLGIVPFGKSLTTDIGVSSGNGYAIEQNGNSDIRLRLNGSSVTVSTVVQTGDVLQVAVDYATGKLWFGRNNTWYNSSGGTTGNPGAGTNETATISTTTDWFPAVAKYNTGGSYAINFGQRAFAYTAPSGFKALCTQNFTTPTIGATSATRANDYFDVVTYTGTGSTRSITSLEFQPDFTWIKPRSAADHHILYDAVRGIRKQLYTNLTNAEETETQGLSAFLSNGFTLGGAHTVRGQTNDSGVTYASWNWKANGTGVSNTDGQITSTVSVNTTSKFSIVTYTGNGSANQTVGHGLGVAPTFGILKDRDLNSNNSQWQVFHTGSGDNYAYLSTTAAFTGTAQFYPTTASSTTVTVGRDVAATTNESGDRFVMYLFADVDGYSKAFSYASNNSADNAFVYLGFRPRWIMIKSESAGGTNLDWVIYDTARMTYNYIANTELRANLTTTEGGLARNPAIDILSNGFKVRASSGEIGSSTLYVGMAFAESPFKYSLAR